MRLVTVVLTAAFATSVHAADSSQYLCVTDEAAGLHYDKQSDVWRPQAFATGGKYILRHLTDAERKREQTWDPKSKATWGFFEFDDGTPTATCTDELYGFFCHPRVAEVEFGKDLLRFEITRGGSYVGQGYWKHLQQTDPETYAMEKPKMLDPVSAPDDAVFELGTCSYDCAGDGGEYADA